MAPGQKKLSELPTRAGLRCNEQGIEGFAVFVFVGSITRAYADVQRRCTTY